MSLTVLSTDPITLIVDEGRGPQGPEGPQGLPGIDAPVDAITQQDLEDHVESDTPHPVYDDGPSLTLLYLNAKV